MFIVPAVKTLKSHMRVEKSEKVKSKDGGPVLNISAVGSLPADGSEFSRGLNPQVYLDSYGTVMCLFVLCYQQFGVRNYTGYKLRWFPF
jgi:hypothetical protein